MVSGRRWYRSVVKKGKKKQEEGRGSGGRKEERGERDRVTEGGLIPIKNFLESVKKKKKKKTIPPPRLVESYCVKVHGTDTDKTI